MWSQVLRNHSDMVTWSCQVTQGDVEPTGVEVSLSPADAEHQQQGNME